MQGWSLERKIQVTQTRIMEWYEKWNGNVYISFSGGKDSTVLLDLARRIYPDIQGVFVDTGLEYPELRNFVKTVDNIVWLKPQMNFRKVIETYGYPIISKEISQVIEEARRHEKTGKYEYRIKRLNGELLDKNGNKSIYNCEKWKFLMDAPFLISHKCCNIMKKHPAKKYEKETGKKPIVGTMACESQSRRTAWKIHGCNAFEAARPISQPLSFWTEQDVLEYIVRFIAPKYDIAWYNVQFSSGCRRRKARKFLRKRGYSKTGIASVYGNIAYDNKKGYYTTGCQRTGCIFCGFGAHLDKEPNRFQKLKISHPKIWDYCMKSWDSGGLGMKDVLQYINVKVE